MTLLVLLNLYSCFQIVRVTEKDPTIFRHGRSSLRQQIRLRTFSIIGCLLISDMAYIHATVTCKIVLDSMNKVMNIGI